MGKGQKIDVTLEIDLDHSDNFRDWSIVAQGYEGSEGSLTLTPKDKRLRPNEWP